MNAIDIACRRCAAQPKEWCTWNGKSLTNQLHAERIEDGWYWTKPTEVSKEDFDGAVWETGLL